MKSLLDLANRMERLDKQLKKSASDLAVNVGNAIERNLVSVTPVDVTTALSNWLVTLDAPALEEIEAYYPGFLGYTASKSAQEAVARTTEILSKKKPGQKIFITNNTDYIKDLNDGSSKQEPAGFIERAVLIGRMEAKKFKLKGN